TSLIEGANTHFLIRDVLVDLPGRDAIRDFLAGDTDSSSLWVYESNGLDSEVADRSTDTALTPSAPQSGVYVTHTLQTGIPAGLSFVYAKVADPYGGAKEIQSATRSDGKVISPSNVWLSKSRD